MVRAEIQNGHPWKQVAAVWWIAFIPGGLLAGMLVGLLAYIWSWLTGLSFDAPISQLISSAAAGYVCVYAAAWIAPVERKAIPAVIMAVLMLVIYGVSIGVILPHREWLGVAKAVVGVIAVAVSMYHQIERTGGDPASQLEGVATSELTANP